MSLFIRASDLKRTKAVIKTGIFTLDEECGGLSHPSLTVISGEFGAGKSTLGYQVLSYALMAGWEAVVVDTEGTFSLKRITEIIKTQFRAEEMEFNESVLDRLHYALAPTLEELIGYKGLKGKKPSFEGRGVFEHIVGAKLVLIDSLGVIREEFPSRELFYARTKVLSRLIREIAKLRANGVSVIMTDHVYERPSGNGERRIYGGTYVEHFATHHIFIKKVKGIKRKIVTLDFPNCPEMEITAYICRAGLVDAVEASEEEVGECCGPFVKDPKHPRECKKNY